MKEFGCSIRSASGGNRIWIRFGRRTGSRYLPTTKNTNVGPKAMKVKPAAGATPSAKTGNKVYFRLNASPGWVPKVLSGPSMMSGWKTMKNYNNSSQKTTAGQPPVRTNSAVGASYSAEPKKKVNSLLPVKSFWIRSHSPGV